MSVRSKRKRLFEQRRMKRRHYQPRGIPEGDIEELTTGVAPTAMSGTLKLTKLTTGNTGGAEDVTLGNGNALYFEKIVELTEVINPGVDVINFSDLTNIESYEGRTVTKIEMTENEHFIMFRWSGPGGKWEILRSHRGVTIEVG